MSEQLQLRSGTNAQIATFTGASAECVVDTSNNRIVVNDNATAGGWPAAKLSETTTRNRAPVSSGAYAVTAPVGGATWVNMVAYTALTAPSTVSLPASGGSTPYPTGTRLLIVDETGLCTYALPITVTPNGTDTINGVNASVVLNTPRASIGLESNGVNGWTVVDSGYFTANMRLAESLNGATVVLNITETVVSGLSGTTVTVSGVIPANALVIGCSTRVITAITGATAYEIGTTGSLAQFGSGLGTALGSNNLGLIGPTVFYAATNIVITATTGTFSAGALRLALMYYSFNPPLQ